MYAIFDHLTAILVGATLLGVLLFTQMRQQQAAIETTIHARAQEHAGSFFDVAQREVENVRTREQAQAGLGYYVMDIQGTPARTDRFTFVTSEPPPAGSPSSVKHTMKAVSYVLRATGDSVRVGTSKRATYNVERWTNELAPTATSAPGGFSFAGVMAVDVVTFAVRAFDRNNTLRTRAGSDGGHGRPGSTGSDLDPVRFEIEIETAPEAPDFRAGDQEATSQQNLVRVAHSIRPVNVGATGSSTVSGPTAEPRDIPLLPGEPAPPPKPRPQRGPTSEPSPGDIPTPNPGHTPAPKPTPDPPRPMPSGGPQI